MMAKQLTNLARPAFAGLLLLLACKAWAGPEAAPGLARIHEQNDEFELAIEQYQNDITELETAAGPLSIELVEPLTGLGRSYLAVGEAAAAEEALRRAQQLTHLNEGVHSLAQLPAVDILTEKFLREDEPLEADRQQRFALFVSEHQFGKVSPEAIPALRKMSDWYIQTGQYRKARDTLDRMIEIATSDGGEFDLRQLEPLMMIATTRRLQGVCCSYRSLETAREVVESNPAATRDMMLDTYLSLADAYIVSRKEDEAYTYYKKAWDLVRQEDGESEIFAGPRRIAMSGTLDNAEKAFLRYYRVERDAFGKSKLEEMTLEEQILAKNQPPQEFVLPLEDRNYNVQIAEGMASAEHRDKVTKLIGQPFKFNYDQLSYILPLSLQSREEMAGLYVTLSFDVDETGNVHNPEITDSNAPVKLRRLMRTVLGKTVFRPAFTDGQPIASRQIELTQTFQ